LPSLSISTARWLIPAVINGTLFVFSDMNHYLAMGRLIDSPDPSVVTIYNDPVLLSSPPSAEAPRIPPEKAASYRGASSIAYSLFLSRAVDVTAIWGAAFAQCAFVPVLPICGAAFRHGLRAAPVGNVE
jgi:hypothetical protein